MVTYYQTKNPVPFCFIACGWKHPTRQFYKNISSWGYVWSPGKSYLSLQKLRKLFSKIWSVLIVILFLTKLILDKISWKFWSIFIIYSPPGKSYVFLLHPSLLENLMCSRNLFKKVAPGKKVQIFQQNSSPAGSVWGMDGKDSWFFLFIFY